MIWTTESSPGSTDGQAATNEPYSVFIDGGELYSLFNDQGNSGEATLKYYHDAGTADAPSFSWVTIGTAGFNTDNEAVTEVSAAAVGFAGDIYAAFMENGAAKLWKYNTTTETWFDTGLADADYTGADQLFSLTAFNNSLYTGYEKASLAGLYLRAYDDNVTALQAGGEVTSTNIDDDNAVFVSGGGSLYAVYIDAAGFNIKQLDDGVWTALSNTTGKPVTNAGVSNYGALAAHWFDNSLYVFYIDSSDTKGWVKYYDSDDGWLDAQKIGAAAITGTGVTKLQLASSGSSLYAGYIEAGTAYIRVLK